jgi:hypothetical protein
MYNRNRITNSGSSAEAWKESVVRDRGGEGSGSARSRTFPSSSLPPRPPARTPAAHPFASPVPASNSIASRLRASRVPAGHPFTAPLPASNPFTSRVPASNSIASRLRASRPLSAPGDGSSDEIQSEDEFFSADNKSVSTESEDRPHYNLRELMDEQSVSSSASSSNSSDSDSNDPAVQNLRGYGGNFGYIGTPPWGKPDFLVRHPLGGSSSSESF